MIDNAGNHHFPFKVMRSTEPFMVFQKSPAGVTLIPRVLIEIMHKYPMSYANEFIIDLNVRTCGIVSLFRNL
jgi:hypothetical protein